MNICLRGRQHVDFVNIILAGKIRMSIILWWRTAIKSFTLPSDRVEKVMTDPKHQPLEYSIVKTIKGSELVGKDSAAYSKIAVGCITPICDDR